MMQKTPRNFFPSFSIRSRLFLGFGLMIIFIVGTGIVAVSQMNLLSEQTQKLYKHPLIINSTARDFSIDVLKMRTLMLGQVLLANTVHEVDETAKKMEVLDMEMRQYLSIIRERYLGEQADIDVLEELFNTWKPLRDQVIELVKSGKSDEAVMIAREGKLAQHINKLLEASSVLTNSSSKNAKIFMENAILVSTSVNQWMLGIIITISFIGVVIAWSTSRAITQPLYHAMHVANNLAEGHLNNHLEIRDSNEVGQLMQSLALMVNKLVEIITVIKQTSALVNKAAAEISQGNLNLSQRTEQQASFLEQTAASMQEMTSTVEQNTNNASQATQLASIAKERAEQGGKIANAAIEAMSKINVSSKKVADIISVINEIAFQTNLLALNAAVEAARAGEQGRGFAVVATEVRNLAQRSATAAKEIKELIRDSVIKVDEGTKLVNQSGEALQEIVIAVKKVSDIVTEIAAASREQSSGIHQVNKAVAQMDEMTQQNAALVEEAASASESMRKQAEFLNQQIAFFHLDNQIDIPHTEQREGRSEGNFPTTSPTFVTTPKLDKLRKRNLVSNHHHEDDDGWRDF
jgi:methyl-accepting chemotaxis protein